MTMKKVIFATAFVAVSGFALAYGMDAFRSQDKVAALQLDNAEVLAGNEGGSFNGSCWTTTRPGGTGFWRCGYPCIWVEGYSPVGSLSICA